MDDLETFLLSKNPLGILRGDQQDRLDDVEASSQSSNQVFLAKGTNLLLNPVGPRPDTMSELEDDRWVDVFDDDAGDTGYYEVLVPGHGLGRVRRVDVQSQRVIDQSHDAYDPPDHRGIMSLTLNLCGGVLCRTGDVSLCRILRLVGGPLEALTVSYTIIQDITLILMHARYSWNSNFMMWDPVFCINAVTPTSPAGAAWPLWWFVAFVGNVMRRISSAFCEKLCDPELEISQTLTKLTLSTERNLWTDIKAASMEKMLVRNQKLVSFSLSGRVYYDDGFRARLREHNNSATSPKRRQDSDEDEASICQCCGFAR